MVTQSLGVKISYDDQRETCLDFRFSLVRYDPWHRFAIGEIVSFDPSSVVPGLFPKGTYLGKRVAGVPGDQVDVCPQGVKVNRILLSTDFSVKYPPKYQSITISPDHYFVIGTAPGSFDSRYYGLGNRLMSYVRWLTLTIAMIAAAGTAYASGNDPWGSGDLYIDDAKLGDFLQGKSWSRQPPKDPAAQQKPADPQSKSKQNPLRQKVALEWLRQNLEIYERRAQETQKKEDIEAYMYLRRVLYDKAQNYATRSMEVLRENPLVDENNRIPYASLGQAATVKVNLEAIDKANAQMAEQGGLWVFVDSQCSFCQDMLNVIRMYKRDTGMPVLVISIDGKRPRGYSDALGPLVTDNGFFRALGLQLTPSVVYLHQLDYKKGIENNYYLIVSQGFYTLDKLQRTIAYAGYASMRDSRAFAGLLSPDVVGGLNAWNKGVMASKDINDIEIDPLNPASIKQAIEPYLAKSMQSKRVGTVNARP
ncbi:hypothetical protein DFQ28_007415 [Apophysomyces sp. BC1034]|nr:hypothetical protein DFQ28_007415 [Apophysomyces sp. BC1034]